MLNLFVGPGSGPMVPALPKTMAKDANAYTPMGARASMDLDAYNSDHQNAYVSNCFFSSFGLPEFVRSKLELFIIRNCSQMGSIHGNRVRVHGAWGAVLRARRALPAPGGTNTSTSARRDAARRPSTPHSRATTQESHRPPPAPAAKAARTD